MGLRHTAQPHFYIPTEANTSTLHVEPSYHGGSMTATKANTPTLHVEPSYHGGSITATVDKYLIAL